MRRSFWLGVLSWATLAALAFVVPAPSHAQDGEPRLERQMGAAAARQAREAERARVARQRWESERRRSAAHARMPDTMYASTPSAPAVELSCPVVSDDDVRRAVQGLGDEVSSSPFSSADRLAARDGGVLRAPPLQGVLGSSRLSGDDTPAAPHDGWSAAVATVSNADTTSHLVPLFPAASDAALQGFVRVINHSGDSGEVQIDAIDDTGVSYGPLTLSIDGDATVHFNSDDLESGNAGKGLTGSTGAGEGDWRLVLTSGLDVEVLSYIRTTDGFLTAMHDLAPEAEGVHRIAIFNPGSNAAQVSRLRLINPGEEEAQVTIEGVDDRGASPGSALEVTVAAGVTQTLTAAELESGGSGMTGALGDGAGKWQLTVKSESSIHALSLLSSPTGHLTNLSTAPSNLLDGVHEVSLFPSASDASGRQGFVRVINRSESPAEITIRAHDETDWEYEPLTLSLGSGQVAHFNSDDLDQGNAGKGLTGSTGAGEGDWRLELSSESDIEVLSYIRTTDGFLTAMHDVAPVSGTRHRVAIFNPGSNTAQVSRLRLVNAGEEAAAVTIVGTDDQGLSPGGDVLVTVPAGGTRTYTAQELEEGAEGLEGALGDGAGKWRLEVTSDVPIHVLSLLSSPTGHLTNLSTAPQRGAGPVATAEELFRTLISGPILQTKCINCHVEGGVSGNTRLVFVTDADADHMATNLSVFEDFLAEVEDGADLILNKVQGVSHGGGIQLASGTEEFSSMERFLGLLAGEEVAPVTITPATLFEGVKMESWRSTLRRAAIIFAGRIPTDEEYESIRGATVDEFRAAIRNLMQGPEFHEFLIRASNDRLLTDRDLDDTIDEFHGYFPNLANKNYRLAKAAHESGADVDQRVLRRWQLAVQYGFARAPLELIAYVAATDRPYTEILTADYIMANALAAEAYGASTVFEDDVSVREFRPSMIEAYYRKTEGYVEESVQGIGNHVLDPGPLATEYPHAGILNTTVFLLRYPTTATNRNRARSRWTYYHFLGLDVEKSAARTTDPVALADTNNPTMNNSACTVCHRVLDPVAGAFQNYGDEGLYRDQWGGMDSLDGLYKFNPPGRRDFAVTGRLRGEKAIDLGTVGLLVGRPNELGVKNLRTFEGDTKLHLGLGELVLRALGGEVVQRYEIRDVAKEEACGDRIEEGYILWDCGEMLVLPLVVPNDGHYTVEIDAWVLEDGERAATLQAWMPGPFYREGDTWYRDMRTPGFQDGSIPDPDQSLHWLAKRIAADPRFAEATVQFWWPAVMGSEVAEPPADRDDADFHGLLLASSAQTKEIERLGRGFRQGIRGRSPYNLKDLLVEIVLSKWFRAIRVTDEGRVRTVALKGAGAKRLLTPEELTRKTRALTGFQWGRERYHDRHPAYQETDALTEPYRLLYGGIDSGGIVERAVDVTSVMAGVAKSHAAESSCPIVLREFYLLPDEKKRLFADVDINVSPVLEAGATFSVKASSWDEREPLRLASRLAMGVNTLVLRSTNYFRDEDTGDERHSLLDRVVVRDTHGKEVHTLEMEDVDFGDQQCNTRQYNEVTGKLDHVLLWGHCSLSVPIEGPYDGDFRIEIVAWADQVGGDLAELEVLVESDSEGSAGAMAIRRQLVDLHEKLLGLRVGLRSREIERAYRLFVDVWKRKRHFAKSESENFFEPLICVFWSDHRYFDGILEDANRPDETGPGYRWNWDRVNDFVYREVSPQDPAGVGRTWVVVLAYLLTDYRYLYL